MRDAQEELQTSSGGMPAERRADGDRRDSEGGREIKGGRLRGGGREVGREVGK